MKFLRRSSEPNSDPFSLKKVNNRRQTPLHSINDFLSPRNRIKVNFLFPISGPLPNICTLTWASLGRWGGTSCWTWRSTARPSDSWWLVVGAGMWPLARETTWTRNPSRMSPSILSGELYKFHSRASPTVNQSKKNQINELQSNVFVKHQDKPHILPKDLFLWLSNFLIKTSEIKFMHHPPKYI